MQLDRLCQDCHNSATKASDNQELLQKCISIRKILFENENEQTGRFTFQDRISQAKNKLESFDKNEKMALKLRPQCTVLSELLPVEEIKRLQQTITEYPDQKMNELTADYLKSLVELASIINYRMKTN